jgi:lysocardiolipin and lysophospholipid acyltransferase
MVNVKSLRNGAFGLIFVLLITTGAITSTFLFLPWLLTLPLMPFLPLKLLKIRRSYVQFIAKIFFSFAAGLLIDYCGTKVIIHSSDNLFLSDPSFIVMSNHRSRVDWMYCGWCYIFLMNQTCHLTFILKESLKSVPFYGWCMQIMVFIFLSRQRDLDIPIIRAAINYLKKVDNYPNILIFPEGTDLSSSVLKRNNECELDYTTILKK